MASESAGTYDWPNPAVNAPRPEGATYPALPETDQHKIARLESELAAAREREAVLQQIRTLAEYLHTAKANPALYGPRKCVGVEEGWHDAAGRVLNLLAQGEALRAADAAKNPRDGERQVG